MPEVSTTSLPSILPDEVNINVEYTADDSGADSYFDLTVNDTSWSNPLNTWCIDYHTNIGDGNYTATVYSSYETIPDNLVTQPEYLDSVNWILNQDFTSNPEYTALEVQQAIWLLIESDYDATYSDSILIADLARQNGDGFIPGPGSTVGVIFDPIGRDTVGDYPTGDYQVLIGEVPVDPRIDIEKFTNGENADTLDTAPVVAEGETVTWTYEVTNSGNVAFQMEDVVVTDDQGVIPVLDPTSDVGNDGILSVGETWTYIGQGVAEALLRDIDFETDAAGNLLEEGTVIDDEYLEWGLQISRVSGDPKDNVEDGLMILDSSNPKPHYGDRNRDLGTANQDFGGPGVGDGGKAGQPGENSTDLGNVLIRSRFGNPDKPTDAVVPGIFRFEWINEPQKVRDITFLDLDDDEMHDLDGNGTEESAIITVYEADGNVSTIDVLGIGNNSVQTIDIDIDNVVQMDVLLGGSGAITGLSFENYYQNIGTVTVPGAAGSDASHYVAPDLDIEIKKFAVVNGERFDADTLDEAALTQLGDAISWQYEVTNTGNVDFNPEDYTITVTDDDANVALAFTGESGIADGTLSAGETWYYTGAYAEGAGSPLFYTVDFDTDAQGNAIAERDLIQNQYADWGLTITTEVDNGEDYGATVLDSGNPVPYDKNDDMVTDSEANVLIHSRYSRDSSKQTTDRHDGGTFMFEWDAPVHVGTMQFLDIEEDEGETVKIRTYGEDGTLIDELHIENNNSEGLIEGDLINGGLITVDIDDLNVSYMEVEFDGSGAVTDFTFSRPYYVNTGIVSVTATDGENIVRDRTELIDYDLSYLQYSQGMSEPSQSHSASYLQQPSLISDGSAMFSGSVQPGPGAFLQDHVFSDATLAVMG